MGILIEILGCFDKKIDILTEIVIENDPSKNRRSKLIFQTFPSELVKKIFWQTISPSKIWVSDILIDLRPIKIVSNGICDGISKFLTEFWPTFSVKIDVVVRLLSMCNDLVIENFDWICQNFDQCHQHFRSHNHWHWFCDRKFLEISSKFLQSPLRFLSQLLKTFP